MKCLFSAFLMSIIGLSVFAQNITNPNGYNIFYYPSGIKSSEGLLVNGQPEGWWKSYNTEGVLVSEGNRINHLLDSTWTFYDENGNKSLEVNYKEGKKDGFRIQHFQDEYIIEPWHQDTLTGEVKTYHVEGWLKRLTPYEQGKAHGMEKEFNQSGTVISVGHYFRGILTRREYINRTDKLGQKQGNWKFFRENGNLQLEGTYVNDKKHGFFKEYDENGNFLSVYKFEYDELVEDAKETKQLEKRTSYFPNGKIAVTATYYKGLPEGIRREYDSTGQIIKGYIFEKGILKYEGITDFAGKREGFWKEFYETGELRASGMYKNSLPVGEWKFFFPSQTIEIRGKYNQKGEKDGLWEWYYPNGTLLMEENYNDGELDGLFVEYDEHGNIISKGEYIEGLEDGSWFYKRGVATEIGSYYEGLRIGDWKTFYENGKPATESHYDQGLLNGKYLVYWENGNIKLTGKYISGERVGIWYKYMENGELFLTTIYKNGFEIKWDNYKIEDE